MKIIQDYKIKNGDIKYQKYLLERDKSLNAIIDTIITDKIRSTSDIKKYERKLRQYILTVEYIRDEMGTMGMKSETQEK